MIMMMMVMMMMMMMMMMLMNDDDDDDDDDDDEEEEDDDQGKCGIKPGPDVQVLENGGTSSLGTPDVNIMTNKTMN